MLRLPFVVESIGLCHRHLVSLMKINQVEPLAELLLSLGEAMSCALSLAGGGFALVWDSN